MPEVILGIDTSCYTTSVAFVSNGRILHSERKLLDVKDGEKGLRQAEGVFQHVKNLPVLLEKLFGAVPDAVVCAVCVSKRPRDKEDSYMPVFAVGTSFAESIAASSRVPVYYTSHQQGHIRAALEDSGVPAGRFVALHLSGGTTQTVATDETLSITEIGGTSDLNAGQLVDRAGVMMGLHFPCGPELEKLAVNGKSESAIPVSKDKLTVSFSGAENKVEKLLHEGKSKEDVAMEVYSFLARSIAHLVVNAAHEAGVHHVLLAGGVASSNLLRSLLPVRVKKLDDKIKLHFGRNELSGDNACGVALIGYEKQKGIHYGDHH